MDAKDFKKEEVIKPEEIKLDEEVNDEPEEVIEEEKEIEEVVEEPKQEPKEEEKKEVDYTEKFKSSQKEALRLREENRKLLEEKELLTEKREVTLADLRVQYPDWEDMTEREKDLAKKAANNDLRLKALEAKNQMYLNEKRLTAEISDQLEIWEATGEFGDIVSHKEEFRRFCKQDGNKGVALENLAKLFLYDLPPEKKVEGNTPFSRSVNRSKTPEKKEKMTAEQSAALRKSDPKKWNDLVAKGYFRT